MNAESIPVFLVVETGEMNRYARRFVFSSKARCSGMPGEHSYCNACVLIDRVPVVRDQSGCIVAQPQLPSDDPHWPDFCDACGKVFDDSAERQIHLEIIYRRDDDPSQEWELDEIPPGGCWDATWHHDVEQWCGADGKSLHVRLPDSSDWGLDGHASNCSRPGEKKLHKCWCRHGVPGQLSFHVDKKPEEGQQTCDAGGGSIKGNNGYHGFLWHGKLVPCPDSQFMQAIAKKLA